MSEPQSVTVTGTFSGYTGSVRLARSVWLRSSEDDSVVPPKRYAGTLNGTGHVELTVPASDDPDWTPQDFTYRLTVALSGLVPYSYDVQIPRTPNPVQIADLLPVVATEGVMYAPLAHSHAGYAPTDHTHPVPDMSAYATDAELASAIATIVASLAGQATDAELANAVSTLEDAFESGDAAVLYTAALAYDAATAAIPKLNGEVTDSVTTWRKANYSSAFRVRGTGEAIDLEWIGDIIFGRYTEAGFGGSGEARLRLHGAGTVLAKLTEFGTGVYGGDQFVDANDGKAGFGGKNDAVPMVLCGYLAGTGAPSSGAWDAGQFVVRNDGWWRCTVTGSPGTWVKAA